MSAPVVYIAGPFRGDSAYVVSVNVFAAESAAFAVAQAGAIPLCPHTLYRNFDGTITDQFWLNATMELMRRCDAVLMILGWRESQGARAEKLEAERLGKPVFETLPEVKAWARAVRTSQQSKSKTHEVG